MRTETNVFGQFFDVKNPMEVGLKADTHERTDSAPFSR
jgi:hypothetical protein